MRINFSYLFSYFPWQFLIFRGGIPNAVRTQPGKMFSLGKIKITFCLDRRRVLIDILFQFAFFMQWIVSSKSICFLTGAFGTRTTQQPKPQHSNQCLTDFVVKGRFYPYIGVNVLMRQDNSHFRGGGQWTLWLALSSPIEITAQLQRPKML